MSSIDGPASKGPNVSGRRVVTRCRIKDASETRTALIVRELGEVRVATMSRFSHAIVARVERPESQPKARALACLHHCSAEGPSRGSTGVKLGTGEVAVALPSTGSKACAAVNLANQVMTETGKGTAQIATTRGRGVEGNYAVSE
jgi:hypothetical protein